MTGFLLSDQWRPAKLTLAALALMGACLYGLWAGPTQRLYYEDCLDDQAACQERQIMAVVRRIKDQGPGWLTLDGPRGEVKVVGTVPEASRGKVIDVVGPLSPDGSIALERYHLHRPGRSFKLAISVVPVLVVGFLFWRNFLAARRPE